jgi:hypothetical protein
MSPGKASSDACPDGGDQLAGQQFSLLVVSRPVGGQAQRGEAELHKAEKFLGDGFRRPGHHGWWRSGLLAYLDVAGAGDLRRITAGFAARRLLIGAD